MLDVAEQHFAESSYSAVRIDQIAVAAEVSIGTLYSHFGNKEGLFAAVAERALDRAETFLSAALTDVDDDPVERMTAIGSACLNLLMASPPLARFLLSPKLPDDPALEGALRNRVTLLQKELASQITAGIDAGRLHPVDADAFAAYLISSWCGVLIAARSPLTAPPDLDAARSTITQATTVLMRGLLRDPQTTTSPTCGTDDGR